MSTLRYLKINLPLVNIVIAVKNESFAHRFQAICAERYPDMTLKELGRAFGVSDVTVWAYNHGEKLPSMSTALVLANHLGVCVEWLLTERGPKHPPSDEMLDISHLSPEGKVAMKTAYAAFKQSQLNNAS